MIGRIYKLPKLFIAALALLFLTGLLTACGAEPPTPPPTPEPVPTATATSVPTEVPTEVPTATAEPSATPAASPTTAPTATVDDGSSAYIGKVADIYRKYYDARVEWADYMSQLATMDPVHAMDNEEWAVGMTTTLYKFESLWQEVDVLVAPESRTRIQTELKAMADNFYDMSKSYHDGFYNQSSPDIEDGNRSLQLGDNAMTRLNVLLQDTGFFEKP